MDVESITECLHALKNVCSEASGTTVTRSGHPRNGRDSVTVVASLLGVPASDSFWVTMANPVLDAFARGLGRAHQTAGIFYVDVLGTSEAASRSPLLAGYPAVFQWDGSPHVQLPMSLIVPTVDDKGMLTFDYLDRAERSGFRSGVPYLLRERGSAVFGQRTMEKVAPATERATYAAGLVLESAYTAYLTRPVYGAPLLDARLIESLSAWARDFEEARLAWSTSPAGRGEGGSPGDVPDVFRQLIRLWCDLAELLTFTHDGSMPSSVTSSWIWRIVVREQWADFSDLLRQIPIGMPPDEERLIFLRGRLVPLLLLWANNLGYSFS